MSIEIERKFLLPAMPEDLSSRGKLLAHMVVDQSYLNNSPEVRIRRNHVLFADPYPGDPEPIYPVPGDGYAYMMAVKSGGTLTRTEVEFFIEREVYFDLQAMIKLSPIKKDYYRYFMDGRVHEFSHVDPGSQNEFVYLEVEFESEEAAAAYICPFANATEVTEDDSYKMKNYWKRTRLSK